jgi:putative transposase
LTHNERIALAEWDHPTIPLCRQADLLDVSRSSLYYVPKEDSEDKLIMDAIDEIYTDLPFYGSRRMRRELIDRYAVTVCREHIQRLMRVLGVEAIYPKGKPKTSLGDALHKKYPYLLSGLAIIRPDQVWSADITYIRLEQGWCYLTAILDWFSRYVVAWRLSDTLESDFCVRTLEEALLDGVPDIHNSDQGVQYTSDEYTGILTDYEIRISMDARGRCFDNIFTERLWRTVKYENVYLQSYRTIEDARIGLTEYFTFYNRKRKHQALGYKTPEQLYVTD